MNLLHVDSSILGDNSVTRRLSARAVVSCRTSHPRIKVIYRDLAAHPLPHLTGEMVSAREAHPAQHPPELRYGVTESARVLAEFVQAQIVVIGAPMYNFGIPSQLKAWIDRLAVAGKTFRYTEKGPLGLAGGKTIIVASARGSVYEPGTPMATLDHQEAYLASIFGFLGISDMRFLRAEGVNISLQARAQAIATAEQTAGDLVSLYP